MIRTAFGFILAFMIGVVCRLTEIPVPAPPALMGAGLVVAITLGFVGMDAALNCRAAKEARSCSKP